jgi:hypothetical protein
LRVVGAWYLSMGPVQTVIIACKTIVNEMLPFLSPDTTYQSVEPGLHLQPEKLRSALQAMIDDITAHTATIVLGYGLCSMGVIGLQAACSTLVVPRQDDCIAIFLGSRRAYKMELNQEPGTYFLNQKGGEKMKPMRGSTKGPSRDCKWRLACP